MVFMKCWSFWEFLLSGLSTLSSASEEVHLEFVHLEVDRFNVMRVDLRVESQLEVLLDWSRVYSTGEIFPL